MPTAGLLALLDDITSLLDDVATMTKVASKKTAAVIGDDLALNANQLTGTSAARELPVVAAVAKGSLVNKLILIPSALLITALVPSLIKPLLMIGGAFLCFEGAEKILHKLLHPREDEHLGQMHSDKSPAQIEQERIKGAVVTDFILSAEILVIALGAAAGASLSVQALTLCAIGFGMTILVYGTVALIVKADDFGLFLQRRQGDSAIARLGRISGKGIILGAPKLMKLLSVLGTAAMFLVGGEIIAHGIPPVEHTLLRVTEITSSLAPFGVEAVRGALNLVAILTLGFCVGLALVAIVTVAKRLRPRAASQDTSLKK
jgi:predicted DNA repair protein MutK